MVCRMCKSVNLVQFLDLEFTPPADQFRRKEQLAEPDVYYPLEVLMCSDCGLAQLSHVVSPEILYRNDYPYESSTTQLGRKHWAEFAKTSVEVLKIPKDSLVVDIGSNVGTLLAAFKEQGMRVLGVDPASNIVLIAQQRGIDTLNELFSVDVAGRIAGERGRAAVITATNVFAHVDDLDAFMQGVDLLLDAKGIFIFEAPYFVNLVKNLEYDTIYHEHLSYLSVKPLVNFFKRFDMSIVDIQERDIHGGSFRVFVRRGADAAVPKVVHEFLRREEEMGVHTKPVLEQFARDVAKNRQDLLWLLRKLKHEGKRIAGVSAPAKGMTLLNYCSIGKETLDFVTEKSTLKIGRYTPGGHIPVVSDAELIRQKPDYALLLAWNFADEIIRNLQEYLDKGGKFIIPIPNPRIVDKAPPVSS